MGIPSFPANEKSLKEFSGGEGQKGLERCWLERKRLLGQASPGERMQEACLPEVPSIIRLP